MISRAGFLDISSSTKFLFSGKGILKTDHIYIFVCGKHN